MTINNATKAQISYRHQDDIQRFFKENIKGELSIDHFSLNIFFGNGQSIFLSPTPQMAEELCKHNFVSEDSTYNPEVYRNLSFYPWRSVQRHQTDMVINFIKEEKFGMRSGVMIIRELGEGRYVMYSVATHKKDHPNLPGQFNFLFHCKANYLAEMGDAMYNQLWPVINEYADNEDIFMPKIRGSLPINIDKNFFYEEQKQISMTLRSSDDIMKIKEGKDKPFLKLIHGGRVLKDDSN